MPRPFDIITFDCYGTLIDWRLGLVRAFTDYASARGLPVDSGRVLELHRDIEPALQAGEYRSYREVLREVWRRIAEQLGWPKPDEGSVTLPDSVGTWPPFSDTNEGLARLAAAGYRIGVLSNIDDVLFDETRRHFPVELDLVVTAQAVRSYKPSHAHFLRARREIGDARWLHAAQSYFHDVAPAWELDIPVVWVNRLGETAGGTARASGEVPSVSDLVGWLAQRAG